MNLFFWFIINFVLTNTAYALTAEEGQLIFDELFFPIIGFFGISIMIGLFIKVINRS